MSSANDTVPASGSVKKASEAIKNLPTGNPAPIVDHESGNPASTPGGNPVQTASLVAATAGSSISINPVIANTNNGVANQKKRPAPSPTTPSGSSAPGATDTSCSNTTSKPSTNTIIRVGKDGEPLSEKKLRRLEKNRLSARECRRRKREATENMQGQINQLEGENLRLRLQLQVGEEAEQTNHQKQIDSTKALDELLKSGKASESEIYAKIEEYKEKFADYGRDRRSAMEFHLRNVERLLMPTQTTNFIMNTLKDSSDASAPTTAEREETSTVPKTPKELFTLLVKELEVTPAQAAALKDSRFVAEEMDQTLQETLNVLKELRGRLARCGQDLETEFNCIRQILTPSQSAKFLVWVAQNKACMHMLNELWSKNYPMGSPTGIDASQSVSFDD